VALVSVPQAVTAILVSLALWALLIAGFYLVVDVLFGWPT
jgi:hypothetical protein